MAKILTLSSQVSQGFVGNSATSFALQRLGHEVCNIPTVLLSNHPAQDHYGGIRLKPSMLRPIIEGLDMNGYLENVDAIMTGYLPTEELVRFAIEAVSLVKAANPDALYLCDPVLGDGHCSQTGDAAQLYIEVMTAKTIQYELLPLSDITTPNRFELSWLTGQTVNSESECCDAIEMLSPGQVLATSVPERPNYMANILRTPEGLYQTSHKQRQRIAHGTDLLAAFYLAEYCDSKDSKKSLAQSTAYVDSLASHSQDIRELNLIGSQHQWSSANPAKVSTKKQKTSF